MMLASPKIRKKLTLRVLLLTTVSVIFFCSWSVNGFTLLQNAPKLSFQSSSISYEPCTRTSLFSTTYDEEEKVKTFDEEIDVSQLPLPPSNGMNIYRNIRDSVSYLINADRFVKSRSEQLGPIFLSYQFFKPIVYCGGQKNVQEFIAGTELKARVVYPTVPDSFLELHTKWGTLNLDSNDPVFKESRVLFADVLSNQEALKQYTRAADEEIEAFVIELQNRVKQNPEETIYLVPELKSLCLQIFSKIFSGKGLTKEQEQQFIDYNSALLSLSKQTTQFKKGKAALDSLKAEMLDRYHQLDDPSIPLDTPGKWYHDQIYGRENFGNNDDRIGTGIVLFIWGAYVECASLMINSIALMVTSDFETIAKNIRIEIEARKSDNENLSSSDPRFWSKGMSYTTGVLRETLRLEPPGSGVPRFSKEDFALSGYRIPAETAIVMEPRIGNNDPTLHPEPQQFEPMRWVSTNDEHLPSSQCPFGGKALKNGVGSWFPGGFGAHKCPGVPLAELISKIFLTKVVTRFDSWQFSGDGLDKDGKIDYVTIPVKIPPDNFGLTFKDKD